VANLFLVGFNMIPAFPMDGGRVLRALLARRMDFSRATRIAATVGQGAALVFGFLGLFGNPFLLFIALFVWIGASQEAAAVQMKTSVSGVPVSRAMLTDFQTLSPTDSLRTAVEMVLRGSQADFPVLDRGRLTGVLTRGDLLKGLASHGPEIAVESVVHRQFEVVPSTLMLEHAVVRLHETEHHVLPVMDGPRLVGLLTAENLAEFLMIRSAMEEARGERPRHGSGLRAAAPEFP
jgi:CBS domain-containing protein